MRAWRRDSIGTSYPHAGSTDSAGGQSCLPTRRELDSKIRKGFACVATGLPARRGPGPGADALRTDALPASRAGAAGEPSGSACALVASRNLHAGGAVGRDPALNACSGAGGDHAVSDIDTE